MRDILQRMIDCVNRSDCEIAADFAFRPDFLKRAVTDRTAYFAVERMKNNAADIKIYVYTPVSDGGIVCSDTAGAVCKILSDGGFELSGIAVGNVEYNGNSRGFVSEISAEISGGSDEYGFLGGCLFIASKFSGDGNLALRFRVESYEVSGKLNEYPIMTIFENMPIDVFPGDGEYTIKLRGVRRSDFLQLFYNGTFDLGVSGDGDIFERCFCESVEYTEKDMVNLTVRGYREYGIL